MSAVPQHCPLCAVDHDTHDHPDHRLLRSCEASGVPLRLEDEAAAAQIARILRTEHEAREKLAGYNERALAAYDEMRCEENEEF